MGGLYCPPLSMINFYIKSRPRPQQRHRSSGRNFYYDPSSKDKKVFAKKVIAKAPKKALKGEIMIRLLFVMPRPKSHYRTGKFKHMLKYKYEKVYYHTYTPDLDNLVKFICDTIQGKNRIILDDSQICRLQAEKVYGETPRTEVIIQEI